MKNGCINIVCWLIIFAVVIHRTVLWFGWKFVLPATLILLVIIAFVYRNSIYVVMGQVTFTKNHEKGFSWFEKAYKSGRMKPQHALFYAYLLLRDGELEKSAKMIDEVGKNKKTSLTRQDFLNSRLNRALIQWKAGDRKKAIEMIQGLYDEGFITTALYGVLGYLYIEDGEYQKALKINKEASEYNSTDLIIADNLALNYLMLDNFEISEKLYLELLEKNPDFIEPYYNYATLLEKQGKKEEAIEFYKKALTYKEKYLSTVSHKQIEEKIKNIEGI